MLDVGCGNGFWTEGFLANGAKVTAIDKSSSQVVLCQHRNPQARVIKARAERVELGEKFDMIFCKDVIEHVLDDKSLLRNLCKHSQTGGVLILGTQNKWSLANLIDGGYYLFFGDIWRGYDPTHCHFYNPYKLSKMLKVAGWKPIKWLSTYHYPYLSVNQFLFKHSIESWLWHLIDILRLNGVFPFNYTGFNLVVIARAI